MSAYSIISHKKQIVFCVYLLNDQSNWITLVMISFIVFFMKSKQRLHRKCQTRENIFLGIAFNEINCLSLRTYA